MSGGGDTWHSVACRGLSRMEVKIRPWCCFLDTAVVVVGAGVAAIYLVVGVLAVAVHTIRGLC